MGRKERSLDILIIVAVTISAFSFIAFVYGYPSLFPRIEATHPSHFERRVAESVASGAEDRAVKIARKAQQFLPLDPVTHAVYGNALLSAGEQQQGLEQLEYALHMLEDGSTTYTRNRFYLAPARLRLGQYYLDSGRSTDAVASFELARGYANLAADSFRSYRDDMYKAYASHGLWQRALVFGKPSVQQLKKLGSDTLVDIGHVLITQENWAVAQTVEEELLSRNERSAVSGYIAGRVALARQDYASSVSALTQAHIDGHADAAYFLGEALYALGQNTEAIEAYSMARSESPYEVFACGKAMMLLRQETPESFTNLNERKEELHSRIDAALNRLRDSASPIVFDKHLQWRPVAVSLREGFRSGGYAPLAILWQTSSAPMEVGADELAVTSLDGMDSLQLSLGPHMAITLQWPENELNWTSTDDPNFTELPGWIDTARDWFELRTDYAAFIERSNNGDAFLVIPRMTWFYSVPTQISPKAGYVLAGRIKRPVGKGSIGWQAIDEHEFVMASAEILQQSPPGEWTADVGYIHPLPHWNAIRVELNVAPGAGQVAFDDVMLLEVREPELLQ